MINTIFSEKNKENRIIDKFEYRFHKMLVNDVERWSCTNKKCKCYFKGSVKCFKRSRKSSFLCKICKISIHFSDVFSDD